MILTLGPGRLALPLAVLHGTSELLTVALVLGIGVGTAVATLAILRITVAMAGRTRIKSDDELARRLPLPLAIVAGAVASGAALRVFAQDLDAYLHEATSRFLVIVLVVGAGWLLVRSLRVFLDVAAYKRPRLEPATRVSGRVIAVAIFAAAILIILAQFGIYVTPILAGLGIAGIVIGLALQDTMANFFAGIWIQTEQPIAPGHYIRVEGQTPPIEGFVDRVGWRATRLRVLAGNLVVIPNSKLSQSIVTDFNMPAHSMSVVMNLRVGFDVDPERVMGVLVEEAKAAAKEYPDWILQEPAPFANCAAGFGEYGIGYSLIIRVPEFVAQWNAQTVVWKRLWKRFHREGIPLLYPTRLNLQADGKAFAPEPPGETRKVRKPSEPLGQDPMQLEAEKAKRDIAQRQKAEGKPVENPPQGLATPPQTQAAQEDAGKDPQMPARQPAEDGAPPRPPKQA